MLLIDLNLKFLVIPTPAITNYKLWNLSFLFVSRSVKSEANQTFPLFMVARCE